MKTYFDETGSMTALRQTVDQALNEGAGGLVVLACDGNEYVPAAMEPWLKAVEVPLIGGIFPAVIHGGRSLPKGSVVLGFKGQMATATLRGLSLAATNLDRPLEDLADNSAGARTMVVFVDGFSPRIAPFIGSLFDTFGLEINYIGGGAGSLTPGRERWPCLFSNSGMFGDGAVMALTETPSGVGAAHGWQPMGEPMQATDAEGNVLKSIGFKNAFEVYAQAVAQRAGVSFEKDEFFEVSRRHPFGIARINGEMIVRDLLKVASDGALVCAGEIPLDCYVSIMKGDKDDLIAAAEHAAATAVAALPGGKPSAFLLMDCISRRLFLEERFGQELARMAPGALPSVGACTIGEIANCGAEFLEFYNKTAVVAAMGEV